MPENEIRQVIEIKQSRLNLGTRKDRKAEEIFRWDYTPMFGWNLKKE